jgi:hypothetical protein
MYRYFTKDEIAFKNGGNINFTYEIGGLWKRIKTNLI